MTPTTFFMTRCLEGFWTGCSVASVIDECKPLDLLPEAGIALAKALNGDREYRSPVSVWIARNFRPVSNAMFNKKPITECVRLWETTKWVHQVKNKLPNVRKENAELKGARLGREVWAQGWRAKADWKTVK